MKFRLEEGAFTPTRAHPKDAGVDLYAIESVSIPANGYKTVRTGVHVELSPGHCGLLVSRSGLNSKFGITSTGLIDEGYTGEILVTLHNSDKWPYLVAQGDKITQIVEIHVRYGPVEIVDEISGSERGSAGFGSTGR